MKGKRRPKNHVLVDIILFDFRFYLIVYSLSSVGSMYEQYKTVSTL